MDSILVNIPGPKSYNTFFDEISRHSSNQFANIDFLSDYEKGQVLLIHWPESLLNWSAPRRSQITQVKKKLNQFKQSGKIIYVVNNLRSHTRNTSEMRKLYELVEGVADVHVHFGKYSEGVFKEKYPGVRQELIAHPTYDSSFLPKDKEAARKLLEIDNSDIVLIAPGRIRKKPEAEMIISAFESISNESKMLLVPAMYDPMRNFDFRGRTRLKKLVDVKKIMSKLVPRTESSASRRFGYESLSNDDLATMVSASDIVFIPRKSALNSGIFYLAMTFKKIVVGPSVGNLSELFEEFGLPSFDPDSEISVGNAVASSIEQLGNEDRIYDREKVSGFNPSNLASKWDQLIAELTSEPIT